MTDRRADPATPAGFAPDPGDARLLRHPDGRNLWRPDLDAARLERGIQWTGPAPRSRRDVAARLAAAARAARLHDALVPHMTADTCADPGAWRPGTPCAEHCAVVAAIARELLGGGIVKTLAHLPDGREIGHYYNLIDGVAFDATRAQFPAGTLVDEAVARPRRQGLSDTRAYILSVPATARRHARLRARLDSDPDAARALAELARA